MVRRIAAVALLSLASLTFALRFRPPVTDPVELDAILDTIEVVPQPPETTRPSYGTLPATTTTTAPPLPPGVRIYDSDPLVFARGALQLRATIEWGELVDLEMIRVPASSRRARQTSLEAGELLRTEALELQHYRLHTVSGATETSWMYMRALRDVLREAELCVDPKCDLPLK